MAVLYRKYRPQTFSEVLNQKPIIRTLQNQVKSGQLAHAYLFTGSRGVGKTSVARILAKAVNCVNQKDGEACGVCDVCKAVAENNFLDLVEIDAASNTGVDNIRELIEHVKFSPTSGKYKVFIIDEVHMLSKGAFNALLKTLEEPPKHAIFILATTEINKLPATIVSRTQRFDFKAYAPADLMELLEKISKAEGLAFKTEVLELVAQNAQGSARDALSLLEKLLTLGASAGLEESRQLLGVTDLALCEDLLDLISLGKASDLPTFFLAAAEKGADYLVFTRDFLEFLRTVLVFKISQTQAGAGKKTSALAEGFTSNELIFIIRLFLKAYKDLPASPDPQIPLLLAAVEASLRRGQSGQPETSVLGSGTKPQAEVKKNYELVTKSARPVEAVSLITTAPAAEPAADSQQTQETIELAELRVLWPKVIEKIRQINGPLASLVRSSSLEGVEGNKVILGVKFLFNKQNLENPKNFSLISENLKGVTGKRLSVAARVVKEIKNQTADTAETLSEALKVFGGELIE